MKNKVKVLVTQTTDAHINEVNKDFAAVLRQYNDYQKVKRNYYRLGGFGLGLLSVATIAFISITFGAKKDRQSSHVVHQQSFASAIDMGPYPHQVPPYPNITVTSSTPKDESPVLLEKASKKEVVAKNRIKAKPKEELPYNQDPSISILPNSSAEPIEGFQHLYLYFFNNLSYPEELLADSIEGVVKVAFVVNVDSTISNLKVLQSLGTSLDKEALRLVENMPRWMPAVENGIAIPSTFIIPIRFNLEDNE